MEELDLTTIEGKIINYGRQVERVSSLVENKSLSPEAKTHLILVPCVAALFQAGDIISALIDKMEASCCTLDETKVKVDKNEADIVILKAK